MQIPHFCRKHSGILANELSRETGTPHHVIYDGETYYCIGTRTKTITNLNGEDIEEIVPCNAIVNSRGRMCGPCSKENGVKGMHGTRKIKEDLGYEATIMAVEMLKTKHNIDFELVREQHVPFLNRTEGESNYSFMDIFLYDATREIALGLEFDEHAHMLESYSFGGDFRRANRIRDVVMAHTSFPMGKGMTRKPIKPKAFYIHRINPHAMGCSLTESSLEKFAKMLARVLYMPEQHFKGDVWMTYWGYPMDYFMKEKEKLNSTEQKTIELV